MRRKEREVIILALIVIILMTLFVILLFWFPKNLQTAMSNDPTRIKNPAATNCISKGYKYEIRTSSEGQGQYGMCVDELNNECEAWSFFRDECQLK